MARFPRIGLNFVLVGLLFFIIAGASMNAWAGEGEKEYWEWFENPKEHCSGPGGPDGPGGGVWDGEYRSMIQASENAVSKGYPSHVDATKAILEDAGKSAENTDKHMRHVLFIKCYSQKYRPEEATEALRAVYAELIKLKLGVKSDGVASTSAPTALPFADRDDLKILRDVVYGKDDVKAQVLDAFLVQSKTPTPVLIEIHGGGWRRGVKSQFAPFYPGDLIAKTLDAGISVISIDYRKTTDGHPLPAQIHDTARAIQFIRSQAGEWNIDLDRIAAMGGSAGAHLSCMLAFHDDLRETGSDDPVSRFSTRLSCAVNRSGPMDLTRLRMSDLMAAGARGSDFVDAYTAAFDCGPDDFSDPEIAARVKLYSPLFQVTPDDPPVMLVYGGNDAQAKAGPDEAPAVLNDPHSIWHGVLLRDKLKAEGVPYEQYLGSQVGKDPDADAAAVLSFLRKHLLDRTEK